MHAIAAGFGSHIDHRIAHASGASVKDFVVPEDTQRKDVHQRIAVVAAFESRFAAHRGHAKAVAVMRDAAYHAFHNTPVARAGFGVIQTAKANGIHHGDGPRAHGKDVAQNAADAGGRALERFNKRRMVVRLDLESNRPAVTDIDDPGVLTGTLQHQRALGRQLLQMNLRALVGAMLAPHDAKDAELRVVGLAAQNFGDFGVFFEVDAMREENFRGKVHAFTDIAASIDSKITRPSTDPISGSQARSGCGIMPITLRSWFRMPAMRRAEPLMSSA